MPHIDLEDGEFTVRVGSSGFGKSTTLWIPAYDAEDLIDGYVQNISVASALTP